MATREERLLGYNLVNMTDRANNTLLDVGAILQKKIPITLEPLTVQVDPDGEKDVVRDAEISDIKEISTTNLSTVATVNNILNEFLSRFKDSDKVLNGLTEWSVVKGEVDGDLVSREALKDNASNAVALQVTEVDLKTSGELLSLYSPQMNRHVQPDLVPLAEKRITTFQAYINAACINLRGLDCDTGELIFTKAKDIKTLVAKRIYGGQRFWDRYVEHNAETTAMKGALDYLEGELGSANTVAALVSLGEYVETLCPQLPSVRRWWNY